LNGIIYLKIQQSLNLDYEAMRNNEIHMNLEEELIQEVMKPSRVFKKRNIQDGYGYLKELFGYN